MKTTGKLAPKCVLTAIFAVFLASCEGFGIPGALQVKASPELSLTVPGVIAGSETVTDGALSFASSFVSLAGIREQMGKNYSGSFPGEIYAYKGYKNIALTEDPIHAFLIRYPIFDVDIDFSTYLRSAKVSAIPTIEIPSDIVGYSEYLTPENPVEVTTDSTLKIQPDPSFPEQAIPIAGQPIKISLDSIAKVISDMHLTTGVGIVFKGILNRASENQHSLKIIVPQFNIGSENEPTGLEWVSGVPGYYDTENDVWYSEAEVVGGTAPESADVIDLAFINDDESNTGILIDNTDANTLLATNHIDVRVQVCGPLEAPDGSGGKLLITPYPIIRWKTAKLHPSIEWDKEEDFEAMDLSSYTDDYGLTFDNVSAMLFIESNAGEDDALDDQVRDSISIDILKMTGPTTESAVSLMSEESATVIGHLMPYFDSADVVYETLEQQKDPDRTFPVRWVTETEPPEGPLFDLTETVNTSGAAFKYKSTFPEDKTLDISHKDAHKTTGSLTATVLLFLPMEFKLKPDSAEDGSDYRQFHIQALDSILADFSGGDDANSELASFQDKLNEYNDNGNTVQEVKLKIFNLHNDLASGLYFGINLDEPPAGWRYIDLDADPGYSQTLSLTSLEKLPEIGVFVKNVPDGGNPEYPIAFKYQEQESTSSPLDFSVTVNASLVIDKTIDY